MQRFDLTCKEGKRVTLDDVVKEFGGLSGCLDFIGWQGGTIHQVKDELVKRLHENGMYIRMDGEICMLACDPRLTRN